MIISEKLCKKITTTLVENNLIDPYLYDAYYYSCAYWTTEQEIYNRKQNKS